MPTVGAKNRDTKSNSDDSDAQVTLADAGYHSRDNLEACYQRQQQVLMPESQHRALLNSYHKDRFTHDAETDTYTRPHGQQLLFRRIKNTRGISMRTYRATGAVCRACPAFGTCTRDARHGRALEIGPYDAALRRHRSLMSTEAAKQAYKRRKEWSEPAFGMLKEQQGARRFLLHGLANVSAEWSLLATAFNLRTLVARMGCSKRSDVRPNEPSNGRRNRITAQTALDCRVKRQRATKQAIPTVQIRKSEQKQRDQPTVTIKRINGPMGYGTGSETLPYGSSRRMP